MSYISIHSKFNLKFNHLLESNYKSIFIEIIAFYKAQTLFSFLRVAFFVQKNCCTNNNLFFSEHCKPLAFVTNINIIECVRLWNG
jgi:hypothetical protein